MKKPADDPLISVSVTVLTQLVRYLSALKIDTEMIFRSVGLDTAILRSPDLRIPFETYVAVEEEAARVTGDPYFGLHMGEFVEPGSWSIIGYMMMNCRTLGEAFQKSARYSAIVGNLIHAAPRIAPGKIRIVLSTPRFVPALSRHCFESVFSSTIRMARNLTGVSIRPLELGFSYPQPSSTAEYQRIFCCPVRFDSRETYMVLPMSSMHIPVLLPNAGLLEYFENYAREVVSRIDEGRGTTRAVMRLILSRLDSRTLTIGSVARDMSLSVRTLQCRLKEEGTVFNELLQETRERLAKKYLRENYSVEDITYLLGFAEPSVFRKAFKKWSGCTPKEFREMSLAG